MTSRAEFGRPSSIRVLLPRRKSSCSWSPSDLGATSGLLRAQGSGRGRSARIEPPRSASGSSHSPLQSDWMPSARSAEVLRRDDQESITA